MIQGILTPFRRDRKSDFAFGSGEKLLESKVIQVLMVEGNSPKSSGECPWRTSFGSAIHLLRHNRNDAVLAEMVRIYAREALKKWMPSVTVTDVDVRQEQAAIILNIRFKGPNQRESSVEAQFS